MWPFINAFIAHNDSFPPCISMQLGWSFILSECFSQISHVPVLSYSSNRWEWPNQVGGWSCCRPHRRHSSFRPGLLGLREEIQVSSQHWPFNKMIMLLRNDPSFSKGALLFYLGAWLNCLFTNVIQYILAAIDVYIWDVLLQQKTIKQINRYRLSLSVTFLHQVPTKYTWSAHYKCWFVCIYSFNWINEQQLTTVNQLWTFGLGTVVCFIHLVINHAFAKWRRLALDWSWTCSLLF